MTPAREYRIHPGWRPLLQDLGISAANVLRRAELPEDLLSRPDPRVTADEWFRLWVGVDEEARDPAFPVRLVEAMTAEGFSPVLFATLCSPNLTVALERLSEYKRLVAPMHLDVSRSRGGLTATFRFARATVPPPTCLLNMEAAFCVRLARMGTRERIQPLAVTSPAPPADPAAYERFLGTRVTRGATLSVRFSPDDAALPFLTADDEMWEVFEPALRRRLAELDEAATFSDRVTAALLELLPNGRGTMDDVAGKLAMSRRTLQRRLQGEDTTFQMLLNGTRERLARHYLAQSELPVAEISFLLGFEHPNSFSRAFQDWTGDTPERLRQSLTH